MASSKSFSVISISVCMLLFMLSCTSIVNAQLSNSFYSRRCPNIRSIVRSAVQQAVANERRAGAFFLRLHFHDCFVNGCDGSVLLDGQGNEKASVHNADSLRGLTLIDTIKARVERACPGVVSCADILSLTAVEGVVALGGPRWTVRLGRRDSLRSASAQSADAQLPFAVDNVPNLVGLFNSKGFSTRDLVALSGAHTIGQARCVRARDRIYGEGNVESRYRRSMQRLCPANSGDFNPCPLDVRSPVRFNNQYYIGLRNRQGLLHSDQVLFDGGSSQTRTLVQRYANSQTAFFSDFAAAMRKMSELNVLTGRRGTVRRNCRRR